MDSPLSAGMKFEELVSFFSRIPQVKFAYLFGSLSRGDVGPLSDVDLAVFLDTRCLFFDFRLRLMEKIAHVLGSERFDLVILNDASPVLKYEVIREGLIIKENKEHRVEFEARCLSEYLDTEFLRREQRAYLKTQLSMGDAHG